MTVIDHVKKKGRAGNQKVEILSPIRAKSTIVKFIIYMLKHGNSASG